MTHTKGRTKADHHTEGRTRRRTGGRRGTHTGYTQTRPHSEKSLDTVCEGLGRSRAEHRKVWLGGDNTQTQYTYISTASRS